MRRTLAALALSLLTLGVADAAADPAPRFRVTAGRLPDDWRAQLREAETCGTPATAYEAALFGGIVLATGLVLLPTRRRWRRLRA